MKYGLYLIKLLLLGALIILHFKVIPQWLSVTIPKPPNPPPLTVHLVTLRQPTAPPPIVPEIPKTVKTAMIEVERKQPIRSLTPAVSPQKAVKATPVPKVKKLPPAPPVVKVPHPPAPKIQKVQEKQPVLPTPPKVATVPASSPVAKIAAVNRDEKHAPTIPPIPSKSTAPQENLTSEVSKMTTPPADKMAGNDVKSHPMMANSSTQTKNGNLHGNLTGKSTITSSQKSAGGQQSQIYAPPNYRAAYLHNPKPPYPPLSQQLEEEGTVQLLVHLDARGQVRQVQLKSSSGYARLDSAALQAVQHWRFIPAKQGDTPVAATTIVPITFRLSEG